MNDNNQNTRRPNKTLNLSKHQQPAKHEIQGKYTRYAAVIRDKNRTPKKTK